METEIIQVKEILPKETLIKLTSVLIFCSLCCETLFLTEIIQAEATLSHQQGFNGAWQWGDEILVGFIQGDFKIGHDAHAITGIIANVRSEQ